MPFNVISLDAVARISKTVWTPVLVTMNKLGTIDAYIGGWKTVELDAVAPDGSRGVRI